MTIEQQAIAVAGNVTLDIICKTVDEVPRFDSISFQESAVTPGGCASNVAINLAAIGERVFLIARPGSDQPGELLAKTWKRLGIDTDFVEYMPGLHTGVSVGLVDSDLQPRFIHTSGANRTLTKDALEPESLSRAGIGFLHIAGYFVLPGLLDPELGRVLMEIRDRGILVSLDVVTSPAMHAPEALWPVMPQLDLFLCNQREAEILTGLSDPGSAAVSLRTRGAGSVIVKLGSRGCWLQQEAGGSLIPAERLERVVDTTGAGDAFAAGLLSALRQGKDLTAACRDGNRLGAAAVGFLGAVRLD